MLSNEDVIKVLHVLNVNKPKNIYFEDDVEANQRLLELYEALNIATHAITVLYSGELISKKTALSLVEDMHGLCRDDVLKDTLSKITEAGYTDNIVLKVISRDILQNS